MNTLKERIATLHRRLIEEDPEYRKYISAKTDEESVSGLLNFDMFCAAQILQRAAAAAGDVGLVRLNLLATISDIQNELIGRRLDPESEKQKAFDLEWDEILDELFPDRHERIRELRKKSTQ